MKGLREKYKGKVNVVYKHLPLSFHPFAQPAAEYFEAIAILNHKKAIKFHDIIFDNFSDYAKLADEKEIKKKLDFLMKEIGVDAKAVETNMKKAKKIVQQDMLEAQKLKVRGTPTFFVNGINAKGRIEEVIRILLKDMK